MKPKTVLVTGAGGYIGSEIVGTLLKAGHSVRAQDRFFFGESALNKYSGHPKLKIIRDDVRYCPGSNFTGVEAVIDLAGLSNDPSAELDPRLTEEINVKGCLRVAGLAKAKGVRRFLFSSSCSVYGQGAGGLLTEESPLAPVSLYAKAKTEAEKGLLKLADKNFTVTILRNATCYGLSARMRFDLAVNLMTLHAYKHGRIIILGGGQQWRPFVHIRDVARAFETVLRAKPSQTQRQIFNVGSNEQNYQIARLAQLVKKHFPRIEIEYAPDDPDRRNYHVVFDKLEKKLKFKTTKKVSDGIEEIKQALADGRTSDTVDTVTVKYYKYLIDADNLLNRVKYKGKLF